MAKFIEIKPRHNLFWDFREIKICGHQVFFMSPGPKDRTHPQHIPHSCLKVFGIDISGSLIHRLLVNYEDRKYYTPERLWCGNWLKQGRQKSESFENDIKALAEGLPEKEKELLLFNISREIKLLDSPSSDTFYAMLAKEETEIIKKLEQPKILSADAMKAAADPEKTNSANKYKNQKEEIILWEGHKYLKPYFYGADPSISDKNKILKKYNNIFCKRDIIDAGAFFGDTAIPLADFTTGTVHAFEPDPDNYRALLNNAALNCCNNLKTLNSGLFSEPKTLAVNKGNNPGATHLSEQKTEQNSTITNAESVDSYSEKHNLDIGLIKSDVEGAEKQLLEGAYRTINRCHPLLMISIYHSYDDFFKLKPWLEKRHPGYEYHILFSPGNLLNASSFIAETMLIAVPPQKS